MQDTNVPLRLLSLGKSVFPTVLKATENADGITSDGGGIRGLSSLYVIQSIMKALESKVGDSAPPLRPCEYFDLIAGTSTGG
jgi:patatin-like phospholipase/acyl hydrolase